MPQVISELTVRSQFGQLLKRVKENNERFVVDQGGEPQAVIMGIDDFIRTIAPAPEVLAEIRAASQRQGTSKLSKRAIEQEIKAYRREKRR